MDDALFASLVAVAVAGGATVEQAIEVVKSTDTVGRPIEDVLTDLAERGRRYAWGRVVGLS